VETLLLSRSDVGRLLDPAALVPAMRDAFRAYSMERKVPQRRVRSSLPGGEGRAMVLLPGLVPGIPAYTVKVHAKFPALDPAIRGILHLHDLETGDLLAVMDSGHLTAVRTGVAGAVAADVLARDHSESAAIVGAGAQGEAQLRCLALVRPLRRARAHDTSRRRAEAFAKRMREELGVPVEAAGDVEEAVEEADIVVAATWSREPFLFAGMVKAGAHVTTLGPDEPGKVEVDKSLLEEALFVCDDRERGQVRDRVDPEVAHGGRQAALVQ
jgi:ornithine cyclodeaminase